MPGSTRLVTPTSFAAFVDRGSATGALSRLWPEHMSPRLSLHRRRSGPRAERPGHPAYPRRAAPSAGSDRAFMNPYGNERYHESLGNLPPADLSLGRAHYIIETSKGIYRATFRARNLVHQNQAVQHHQTGAGSSFAKRAKQGQLS